MIEKILSYKVKVSDDFSGTRIINCNTLSLKQRT